MADCRIAGIDVGVKKSHMAILEGNRVIYLGVYDECDLDFDFAGMDAPLTFPTKGHFRECERRLHAMGIRLLPPKFIEGIAKRGMEIAKELREKGIEVYEVYPYATRVILNIAPKANKRKKRGRIEIERSLRKYVKFDELKSHDELDAIISALTVKMYVEGNGEILSGHDGSIIIPLLSH